MTKGNTIGSSVRIGDYYTGAGFNYNMSDAPNLYKRGECIKRAYFSFLEDTSTDLVAIAKKLKLPKRITGNGSEDPIILAIKQELRIRVIDLIDKASGEQIEKIETLLEEGDYIKPLLKY